jgi:hypothetical protein
MSVYLRLAEMRKPDLPYTDYGPEATASLEGLARKPRTWAEFVQTADWSKVLV